ncbi:hypothetical protein GCM10010168_87130 [Actinoplanes ianthinogenes]|uniref:Uncharacterized protein n=1 Tax=Actinoplanes ianthinogenes TaxID=122358 RepID=A0ABN6CE19_9ACTN|nr:hypothetical protein [Actinoplanes ianthinogenes]BCJ42288.1 hypothetical protein Aiant_29450 [Actinoplanes ianthinogenes]GGR54714.1 hypothetical protein GCM10010168_87130 [Actinoplanes ianthinogenes]
MPLELRDESISLVGVVTVDEVEQLVGWLRTCQRPKVSLRRCNHLHTGALQAMLLFRPKITSAPKDAFLAEQVLPLLTGSYGDTGRQGTETP